ncbi:MAG: response regulator [Gammaproteobacteria bacterium]|nr:response regulator [Gammaproteobacteria bacterium]
MSIRIVIAEDDPQIAEIQQRFVNRIEGFEVIGVAHGIAETHDLVEVLKPDLLLLDVYFPDGTGLELLRQMRSNNDNTDVILITAAKDVDTLRDAMHGGVFYFLIKPLVFERLREALVNYQSHRQELNQVDQLLQTDIDKLFNSHSAIAGTVPQLHLPKGVDALTLDKVRQAFSNHPKQHFSAEEMGDIIGASRTTARRYLEYLTSTQEVSAEVNYGSIGRPERHYHWIA